MLKIMADNGVEISAKQDGALYNVALNDQDFIIQGLGDEFAMSHTGLVVTMESGECIIHGRHITADSTNQIALPPNESGYLVIRIDLTKPIGQEALLFVTPTLTHEEINWDGTIYDMPIATFTTQTIDISIFEDVRVIKNVATPPIDLSIIYPIGSIYMSVNSTNPSTLFGFGTWEQLMDRFLLGAGNLYVGGATGGEATHTLTVDEMPSHKHSISVSKWANGDGSGGVNDVSSGTGRTTGSSGGSQPHNNMPPYLAVYMWKRTA